jgi:hypothetical protein
MANTNYSLDPNRDMSWMVVDMCDAVGREGIYSGTYEDCQMYMAEYAKHCSCIGMDIVPNPYYKKKSKIALKKLEIEIMRKYAIK